jgi:riboflavin synthase
MFTGIVNLIGRISEVAQTDGDIRLRIAAPGIDPAALEPGASIAVNGACLTVTNPGPEEFSADVSRETLDLTTLGGLDAGARVNLEPAMTLNGALGGHLVSGHVDGVGNLVSLEPDARSVRMEFEIPDALARYVAVKGSVAIDGTSLTVNEVSGSVFTVNIVPHTLERTIMGKYSPGSRVNIEVDMIARYLERLIQN